MPEFYKKAALLHLILTSGLLLSSTAIAQSTEEEIAPWQELFVEGSSGALVKLAIHYGQNTSEPDPQRAFDLLLVASSKFNDPVAQTNLGLLYQFGQGVETDYARAAYWYQRAVKLNNVDAHVKLGDMYSRGLGTTVDYEKAANFYSEAADNGSSDAQVELGYLYEMGDLGTVDYTAAMELYQQAAEQGNEIGQYNLAEMFELGKGVSIDLEQAQKWYGLSADNGLQEAAEALQRLK